MLMPVRRGDRGFTMMELIVSVGLMVVLLSVLAFVFRQSAEAVSQATEAVNTVQKARNFEARLGRELAAAVQYVASDASGKALRAFWFSEDGTRRASDVYTGGSDYTASVEFVSRTMQDGVLATWDVKYFFEMDAGKDYGAIKRRKDAPNADGDYVLWDQKETGGNWVEDADEILAWPVRPMKNSPIFEAAGDWRATDESTTSQNTELPAYVRVRLVFLDSWGGANFTLPMDFYFPVYQGN